MKMKSAKLMTLMTAVALGIFSGGNVMAAGNGDFYMQPPADSGWQKANTEGAYASYTNGSDYINVYKYSVDDVKAEIARCDDTYEACYQTIYSEGKSLYMAVGYAKDADDISEVRKLIEDISYPGNPSSARQESDAVCITKTHRKTSLVLHRRMHLTARVRERHPLLQMQTEVTRMGQVLQKKMQMFFLQLL